MKKLLQFLRGAGGLLCILSLGSIQTGWTKPYSEPTQWLKEMAEQLKEQNFKKVEQSASAMEQTLKKQGLIDSLLLADCLRIHAHALRKLKKGEAAWHKLVEAEQLLAHLSSFRKYDVMASIWNQKGLIVNAKGDYRGALRYYERIFNEYKRGKVNRREAIAEAYLNKSNSLDYLAEVEQAVAVQKEGITFCERFLDKNHPKIADLWNNMGGIRRRQGLLKEAELCYQKALNVFIIHYGIDHPEGYFFYNNLGNVYFARGNIEKARTFFQKGWDNYLKNYSKEDPPADVFYVNFANCSLKEGANQWAYDYFQKALTIRQKNYGNEHPTTATTYNYLAGVLTLQKKYQEAIVLYQKTLNIYKQYGLDAQPEIADCYDNVGNTYKAIGRDEQALAYLQKGLALTTQIYGEKHYRNAIAWQHIGEVYAHQKQWTNAQNAYERAVHICQANFGEFHPDLAQSYSLIALVCLKQNQQKRAEEYCQRAFDALKYSEVRPDFESCQTPLVLLSIYEIAAKIAPLTLRLKRYQEALRLFDFIQNRFLDDDSRKNLGEKHYELFEQAIIVFLEQYAHSKEPYWLKKAAYLAEKSRYTQLLRIMRYGSILKATGVDNITRQRLSELDEELQQLEQKQKNEWFQEGIVDKLFELKRRQREWQEQLAQKYPKTQQLLTNAALEAPERLINKIVSPQKALIEYVWGEEHLIAFVYSEAGIQFFVQPLNAEWIHKLRAYQFQLTQHPVIEVEKQQMFAQQGYELAQYLLQPALRQLPETVTQLTIVPDGLLNYLPFEALLMKLPVETTPFSLWDFAQKRYVFSYALSINLLSEQLKQHPIRATKPWGGFAASYPVQGLQLANTTGRLYPLGKNKEEVLRTASLTSGRAFVEEEATLENYQDYAADFRTLHLAMHTLIHDQTPEEGALVFSPTPTSNFLLRVQELYQMPLKAELVVLAACQTGVGKWQKGEGVFNLARAFTYAGAKAEVISLWSIPDAATSKIMEYFYQNLARGIPKSQSLWFAKEQYLAQNPAPELAHPYYWAGLVIQGNTATLSFGSSSTAALSIWLFGCVFCLFLFWFIGRAHSK